MSSSFRTLHRRRNNINDKRHGNQLQLTPIVDQIETDYNNNGNNDVSDGKSPINGLKRYLVPPFVQETHFYFDGINFVNHFLFFYSYDLSLSVIVGDAKRTFGMILDFCVSRDILSFEYRISMFENGTKSVSIKLHK